MCRGPDNGPTVFPLEAIPHQDAAVGAEGKPGIRGVEYYEMPSCACDPARGRSLQLPLVVRYRSGCEEYPASHRHPAVGHGLPQVELDFRRRHPAAVRKNSGANPHRRHAFEIFGSCFGSSFRIQTPETFGSAVDLGRLVPPANELPKIPWPDFKVDALRQPRQDRNGFHCTGANQIIRRIEIARRDADFSGQAGIGPADSTEQIQRNHRANVRRNSSLVGAVDSPDFHSAHRSRLFTALLLRLLRVPFEHTQHPLQLHLLLKQFAVNLFQLFRSIWIVLVIATCATIAHAAKTLDIYFIDVEGGQSTLIVTPAGQSLLVDTGFAANGFNDTSNRGRDAQRIVAAVRDAGLKRIDYLLTTHFHADHDGGVTDVTAQIP